MLRICILDIAWGKCCFSRLPMAPSFRVFFTPVLQNLAWEPRLGTWLGEFPQEPCVGVSSGTVRRDLAGSCWGFCPCLETLSLGTWLRNPLGKSWKVLETCSWKHLRSQPCLGACSWEPCLGTDPSSGSEWITHSCSPSKLSWTIRNFVLKGCTGRKTKNNMYQYVVYLHPRHNCLSKELSLQAHLKSMKQNEKASPSPKPGAASVEAPFSEFRFTWACDDWDWSRNRAQSPVELCNSATPDNTCKYLYSGANTTWYFPCGSTPQVAQSGLT